jgi:tetratricopeptide (TPR) repeat protein
VNWSCAAAALLVFSLLGGEARAYFACSTSASQDRRRAQAPIREAFEAKRFGDVDRYFSNVLAGVAAGKTNDADAYFDFYLFEADHPAREALHAAWVKAYPKSEAAYLAQAIYFATRGWNARGSDSAGKTSSTQFASMGDWVDRAMQSLQAAERLSKHPTLEWAAKIDLLKAFRGRDEAATLYRQAITTYPSTVVVRVTYVVGRAARWGGGVRESEQVVEEARQLPESDRRYVESTALWGLATDAETAKDFDQAIALYERQIALCPAWTGSAKRLMVLYHWKRNLPKVIDVANRILAELPTDGETYSYRAFAYGNSGKMAEAFADYKRATELGYAKAFVDLAGFYQMGIGGAPRDLAKALELYTTASEKGIAEGKQGAERVRDLMKRNP